MVVECRKLTVDGITKEVKVVTLPMTMEEARKEFPSRPFSRYAESQWGGNHIYSDTDMLQTGAAESCAVCHAPTRLSCITLGVCFDCSGEAEFLGYDPRLVPVL